MFVLFRVHYQSAEGKDLFCKVFAANEMQAKMMARAQGHRPVFDAIRVNPL